MSSPTGRRTIKTFLIWAVLTTAALADFPVLPLEVVEDGVAKQRGSVVVTDLAVANPEDGFAVLTAAHVVTADIKVSADGVYTYKHFPPTTTFEVYVGSDWEPATLRTISKQGDLAILTVYSKKQVPQLKRAEKMPDVGSSVVGTGYVMGLDLDFVPAIYFGDGSQNDVMMYSPDHRVIPGQSGGAVTDAEGRLIGILSSYTGHEPWVINFVPITEVDRLVSVGWDNKVQKIVRIFDKTKIRAKPRISRRVAERIDFKAPSVP